MTIIFVIFAIKENKIMTDKNPPILLRNVPDDVQQAIIEEKTNIMVEKKKTRVSNEWAIFRLIRKAVECGALNK